MYEILYHYVVVGTAEKNMSIASLLGSAAAIIDRAEGFWASCLAVYLEHDASAAQVEVTKHGNILWTYSHEDEDETQ